MYLTHSICPVYLNMFVCLCLKKQKQNYFSGSFTKKKTEQLTEQQQLSVMKHTLGNLCSWQTSTTLT